MREFYQSKIDTKIEVSADVSLFLMIYNEKEDSLEYKKNVIDYLIRLRHRLNVTKPELLLLPISTPMLDHEKLTVIDFKNKKIENYDSLPFLSDTTSPVIKEILCKIDYCKDIDFEIVNIKVPQQPNQIDCVVATCLNAKLRCTTNDFNYQPSFLIEFRGEILKTLTEFKRNGEIVI